MPLSSAMGLSTVPGRVGLTAGVINDARTRQRRERLGAMGALFLMLLVGLTIRGTDGTGGANGRFSSARPPSAHAAQAAPPVQIQYLQPCLGPSTWYAPCPQ
jgi:hypothetical protein